MWWEQTSMNMDLSAPSAAPGTPRVLNSLGSFFFSVPLQIWWKLQLEPLFTQNNFILFQGVWGPWSPPWLKYVKTSKARSHFLKTCLYEINKWIPYHWCLISQIPWLIFLVKEWLCILLKKYQCNTAFDPSTSHPGMWLALRVCLLKWRAYLLTTFKIENSAFCCCCCCCSSEQRPWTLCIRDRLWRSSSRVWASSQTSLGSNSSSATSY